jgi:ubiquinone/menaquinone biosynthesis C-methylase UbiE
VKRKVTPELLDSDHGTPEEVERSLSDLHRINRWFGGTATTRAMLRRVLSVACPAGTCNLSLLDVGAGSGDIPLSLARELSARGVRLDATLLDRIPGHLPDAAASFTRVAGDALQLPFLDESFDLVSCALLAHHLEPEELSRFAREALRVAKVALLINDLRRSRVHLLSVYAGFPLYRSRLTRHDGPASVRRSYTAAELRAMLMNTGAQRVEIAHHYLFRMGVIAWKKLPTT